MKKLAVIEDLLAELTSEENAKIIKEQVQGTNSDEGGINPGNYGSSRKNCVPKLEIHQQP